MANTSSLHLCVGSARNRLPALARISPSPSEESWFPHYKGILHSALLQGRLILSNKTARTVAFFYTLFLHCLVFLVSVWGTGVGTEIKHRLSPPPGAIWAGLSCCASGSVVPAVPVALEARQGWEVGQGRAKECPPGLHRVQIPPWVGTGLPRAGAGSWLCVPGISHVCSHRVWCVPKRALCLVGSKLWLIIINLTP